jgi:hypothetical protein
MSHALATPSDRKEIRTHKPFLWTTIRGSTTKASDWSAAGMKISNWTREDVPINSEIVVLIWSDEAPTRNMSVRVRLKYANQQNKTAGFEFIKISEIDKVFLRGVAERGARIYPDRRVNKNVPLGLEGRRDTDPRY